MGFADELGFLWRGQFFGFGCDVQNVSLRVSTGDRDRSIGFLWVDCYSFSHWNFLLCINADDISACDLA